jgi:hypothetical protein
VAKQDLPAAPISSLHSLGASLGPDNILATKVSETTRDASPPEKANRTAHVESEPTHIQPGVGNDTLQEASLQIIERQLAAFIGPVAKVLVKRAASKTTSALELYSILAANLEKAADRKAFLARRAELAQGKAGAPAPKASPPPVAPPVAATLDASSPGELTPPAIEQAGRRLAALLGPIAPLLAKKEAKRAANLRNFYELLAEHVAKPADRARFLKEAGVLQPDQPPSFLSARYDAVRTGQLNHVEHAEPAPPAGKAVEQNPVEQGEDAPEPTRKAG